MFVTWGIYLLAVQCLAVTEEGNTARLDKKVPIGKTNTSEGSDVTSHEEPTSPEAHFGIDYVPDETNKQIGFVPCLRR